jgi:hypothetical protein
VVRAGAALQRCASPLLYHNCLWPTMITISLFLMGCSIAPVEPCPLPQRGPPPLPKLVRPEALRIHDAAEHSARLGTEAALRLCAARWLNR